MNALELLAQIQAHVANPIKETPKGWYHFDHYAKAWDVPDRTAREKLLFAVRAGIMERKKFRVAGYTRPIWLYRPL